MKACGVYILELKDGTVIHMLVERRYPLSKDLLQRMLDLGLEVERESTVALGFDHIYFSNRLVDDDAVNGDEKCESWLVQDQTVLGKDYSNLLIVDSLLKTIWFINAPCYGNEALASPKANDGKLKNLIKMEKLLKIRSRCVKVFGYILQELKKINLKKHEVKQVQQSCLGEDCWELYIPDLVSLGERYVISVYTFCKPYVYPGSIKGTLTA
ncbi:hypothetical protein Tco_1383698 [Tanacetum coccineum]